MRTTKALFVALIIAAVAIALCFAVPPPPGSFKQTFKCFHDKDCADFSFKVSKTLALYTHMYVHIYYNLLCTLYADYKRHVVLPQGTIL